MEKATNKTSEKKKLIIFGCALVVLALAVIGYGSLTKDYPRETVAVDTSVSKEQGSEVSEVEAALAKLDDETKRSIASVGVSGYQGDIVKTEKHADGDVKVTVSTHFDEPKEDGLQIARTILSTVCIDSPSVDSLFVVNERTGLESRSAYRSDIPACATDRD